MKTNILATATALSDRDLLARVESLAGTEREAAAELVAHLAALELRPSLYAADGYGSLFDYCTRALHLSEDAACSRIRAVRACRRFPVILELLASGALTLSSVRLLQPHLTDENHQTVLARARNARRQEIEALVAELAPKPDVMASVRKLSFPSATSPSPSLAPGNVAASSATSAAPLACAAPRHRTPGTEPAAGPPRDAYEIRIRPGTDKNVPSEADGTRGQRQGRSRSIPNAVKRAVWRRDGAQCAFVSATGRRCIERNFLELHHIQPYALDGPSTVGNIALRCRRHNAYEAEIVFGPRGVPTVSEAGWS